MTINKNVDIIREDNKDYLNVNSKNRLIAQLICSSAEAIYDFHIPFGQSVDKKTVEEMKGTYWVRVPNSDNFKYNEDVTIAVL
ncbi:MAG: hypothetical protein IJ458_04525 [Clostridia bacterium]|nr:hypothetical protein [Clostridia bacterium]MBQ8522900.1 hypothetical protein [Clostridia bacterium]